MENQCRYLEEHPKLISLYQRFDEIDKYNGVIDRYQHNQEGKKTMCLYRRKSRRDTKPCYVVTDQHPRGIYCEHMLDRRSRLCNYILDTPCPSCQLPTESYYEEEFMNIGRPVVKSRYMDFYYKQQDAKDTSPAREDYTFTQESANNCQILEDPSCYTDEQGPTPDKIMTRRPHIIKSKYMDYVKDFVKIDDPLKYRRMDWKDYHRLHTIHKFLDDLQYNFPSICTTGVIGKSLENRELKVLKVSNSRCGNVSVWIDAGIHAREWIAPAVNTYLANYIVRNFNDLPESVTNKDWYFLPVMNPDGYEFSHTNYRMWRKNKAYHNKECIGVDLNRNFSHGWGGKGSSEEPKSPFYRGPHPFSEPESRAVRDMLKSSGIHFKVYITLHSFGEVIMFPYAYRNELCPDYIRLLEGATVMSKAIHKISGTTYKVGISRDVMYGAAGTSCDWSYGEAKIPFCYLLELRSKKHKFRLPQIEIEETGKEIVGCILALMEFVDNFDANGASKNKIDLDDVDPVSRSDVDNRFVKVAPPLPQVWAVRFTDEGQKCFVRSLDTCGAINIWREDHSTMDFFVDVPRVAQVAAMLHERGIPFSVSIRDVDSLKRREQSSTVTLSISEISTRNQQPCSQPSGMLLPPPSSHCCAHMELPGECMNWKSYHSLRTIYGFMEKLAAAYPYLCQTACIGKTYEGRSIKLLKISNGNPENKAVWLDGDIHAREWVSVAVVTYIANEIVQQFHKQPDWITNKDWYILPVMNPDGYSYTHTEDRMWRKNRTKYGQCVGVDLNRNFSYGWGEAGEDGSSEDPGSIFYRGPQPFSEPETAAVKKVILESQKEFKVFLSLHSYGEVIIFPWGYTGDPCPTYVELLEGGTIMARAIHGVRGRTYKVGSTKDIMYYAAGTSIDWSYGVANIPYSYMIELPCKQHRFLLPKEEIIGTSQEVYSGVKELLKFVDKRCKGVSPSRTSVTFNTKCCKL